MAEELEIIIGANVDDAKQGINSLTATIDNFAKQGKLSIGVLEQTLVNLKKQIKVTTDPGEARKLAEAFQEVQRKLNSLKISGGLESQLNGISRSTRIAHGELDQISRSFEQIASGNGNFIDGLSRIAFSFEQLKGQTGSTKDALKQLGEVLLSPAGLLVAGAALAPLLFEIGGNFIKMADGSRQAKEDIDKLTASLKASKAATQSFNEEIDAAAVTRKLKIDIETPEGVGRVLKELNADLDAANLKLKNNTPAIENFTRDIARLEEATKKAADANKDLLAGSIPFRRNENIIKSNEEQINKLKDSIAGLKKELTKAQDDVVNIPFKIQLTQTDQARADAKKQIEDFQRRVVALAESAQKFFSIDVDLNISKFDSDIEKIRKGLLILQGIREFKILLKTDIQLPEIKELPKEQVEKFFKNVPDALQDAIDKGLIEAQGRDLKIDTSPFAKEIAALIEKFNQAGLTIPVVFDLKDADLLKKLQDAFPIEQIQKNVDELKKSLGTEDTFQGFIRDLIRIGDEGEKAFKETQKQALAAGKSIEQAFNEASAARDKIGGLTKEAGEAALVLQQTLAPAFEDLFSAILQGQAPLDAFFKSLIRGIDQLIAKLIAAALEALILSSITGGIGGFGGIFKALLGFAKGGEPPTDRPSIVGEKGWELIVPKTSMHVFSHEQSKNILSSSVRENESIKEYLIANRVSQQVKEHFNKAVSTITASTYKLHETITSSITSLKESFTNKTSNNFYKESLASISSTIERITEKPSATIDKSSHYETSFKEKLYDKSITANILSAVQRVVSSKETSNEIHKLHEKISSHKSVTIERIINNNFFSTDSFKDTFKSMSIMNLQRMFNIPAFAQGGAVFGPTLAILGEGFGVSRSNPEFVGTASQLKGIQGGVFDVNVNVDGELSFSMGKLAVALNREVRSQLRTSGKNPF